MEKLTLIKLGGSIITDKNTPYTARPEKIRELAREIKTAWNKGHRFVISHGGGSFPHTSASKYKTADGIKNKKDVLGLAIVQQDAFKINRIVNEILLDEGLPALSFVPSSFTFSSQKKLTGLFAEPILKALEIDALPIVFGDIILDDQTGCCIYSGETTLDNLIGPLLKAGFKIGEVIQCGNTDGVYDQKGRTIAKITPGSFREIREMLGGSKAVDVTGGMRHKIEECLKMAGQGIDSLIINGEKKGNLLKAILGEEAGGTLITLK